MKKYAYCRVSSTEQSLARQLAAMELDGIPKSNVYSDKQSGRDFQRKNYIKLVGTPEQPGVLQEGDLLVILSIDRLGRNYEEILDQWRFITKQLNADIKVIDMPLLDTRGADGSLDRTFIADLTLQILSYVAAKERSLIRERQLAGIAVKKANGGYYGINHSGKARKHRDSVLFEALYQQYRDGKINQGDAARQLDISRPVLCQYFKQREIVGPTYDVNKQNGIYEK